MAGYSFCSIDFDAFTKITTSPTRRHGDLLADYMMEELEDLLEEFEDPSDAATWPRDREGLSALIVKRLAMPDWYSDLSYDSAQIWDQVLFGLQAAPGNEFGIDFQSCDYESIYWDCATMAAERGVTIMAERSFGCRGFRYFGKPSSEYHAYPLYSLFDPKRTQTFLTQLQVVEAHFASLPDGEGSAREQFFEGLLAPVRVAAQQRRMLWVSTDT